VKEFDKVQLRMLFDWSDQSPDMIVEEELARIELLVNRVLDAHYNDDTTLDLTIITHEGKLAAGQELKGWTVDEESIWDRIPGDTREEKRAWLEQRHPWLTEE
jgi:hypothetical protein